MRAVPLALSVLVAAACGTSSPGTGGGTTPSGPRKSLPALKLAVLDAVGGRLAYCDPDLYPLPHGSPLDAAKARLPMIESDRDAFQAILDHEHLSAGQDFTDDQLIAINDLYKQMQAIGLQQVDGAYRFDLLVPQSGSEAANVRVIGSATPSGHVSIGRREPGKPLACPICLAAGVRIATPGGDVAVQDVRIGMRVWSTDESGRRIVAVVVRAGRSVAPLGHEVVLLRLADGRTVVASPGHPTADGRTVGELRPGQRLDGSVIVSTELLPYTGFTYDLLPSGPTGTYFADGVLLGSTLAPEPDRLAGPAVPPVVGPAMLNSCLQEDSCFF